MSQLCTPSLEIEELEVSLQKRLWGRVRDLHLELDDNGLVLRGFAAHYYAKQLAQHYAMQDSGLPIAANDIQVFWVS